MRLFGPSFVSGIALIALGLVACTDGDSETSSCDTATRDFDSGPDASRSDRPCVWNQAYQEKSVADSVGSIVSRARGCYVLLDSFDCEIARHSIGMLQERDNTIGCYVSVGTCEDWRDDFDALRSDGVCSSQEWLEWRGEFFITEVVVVMLYMLAWIDMLAQWGCDYVEFDNMDWAFDSYETYEINVDPAAAAAYNVALCDRVHELGMLCMAKSTREGAESFDGMTVESYSDDHPGVGGYRH